MSISMTVRRVWCYGVAAACLVMVGLAAARVEYGPAQATGALEAKALTESSGLAWGWANAPLLWTHNDSGDKPYLYALDTTGRNRGRFLLTGARHRDWEDMASFQRNGKSYLLIGDVGDNRHRRETVTLYLVAEPDVPARPEGEPRRLEVQQTVHLRFANGPRDCEAIAYDPMTNTVLLMDKWLTRGATVYALAWPDETGQVVHIARPIAATMLSMITAMDISPDGRRAIVCTYNRAYEFTRGDGRTWAQAFASQPRGIDLPDRKQGEALCFGPDGRSLYLTSEQRPAKLWHIPAAK